MSAGSVVAYRPRPDIDLRDVDPRVTEEPPRDAATDNAVLSLILGRVPSGHRRETAEMLGLVPPVSDVVAFGLCRRGHKLTSETTYFYMGSKLCRTCKALRGAEVAS